MEKVIVAASLLACDFADLRGEVRRAEAAGADWMHLDVMDGHFVDNISFGPAFVAAARKHTSRPLDVHLMIERPDHYFSRFSEYAQNITVHVEADHDVAKTLRAIRSAGCTAGLALNPPTPVAEVEPFLDAIDLLLVMTVNPGFGGQKFIESCLDKIELAAALRRRRGLRFQIEVDGGIDAATAAACVEKGATVLVAGTSLFGAPDIDEAVRALRGGRDSY